MDFVEKYIAVITVESPNDDITVITRDLSASILEKVGIMGGWTGLFTGFSMLSIISILEYIYNVIWPEKKTTPSINDVKCDQRRQKEDHPASKSLLLKKKIRNKKNKVKTLLDFSACSTSIDQQHTTPTYLVPHPSDKLLSSVSPNVRSVGEIFTGNQNYINHGKSSLEAEMSPQLDSVPMEDPFPELSLL